MRRTINISVSEEMYSVILDRTRDGYYDSVSEYIRALIRKDKFASLEQEMGSTVRPINDFFEAGEPEPDGIRGLGPRTPQIAR